MEKDINNDRKRPLSPHLSIYKPQITSITSIMHRFTGVYLYLGFLLLVWWVVSVVYSPEKTATIALWNMIFSSIIGKLMIFGWSFALFYHLLNGIRHLFWDVGIGFELKTVNKSGIAVLVGTIILLFITWGIHFNN